MMRRDPIEEAELEERLDTLTDDVIHLRGCVYFLGAALMILGIALSIFTA